MENRNGQKFEYDIQKRAQAGLKATFRGVVAAYIVYLGYQLIRDAAGAWQIAAGAVFIAAALAFGVYAFRRWRLDLEAARLPDEESVPVEADEDEPDTDEPDEDEPDMDEPDEDEPDADDSDGEVPLG